MSRSESAVCVAQNMSAIETSRHHENVTLPVDATQSVARVSASATSEDIWWRWLVVDHLLHYGPALCVCTGTVGISLSIVVWIRLQRHLPATILYILLAMMLELLALYMHCGSYTLKQVILRTYSSPDSNNAELQPVGAIIRQALSEPAQTTLNPSPDRGGGGGSGR